MRGGLCGKLHDGRSQLLFATSHSTSHRSDSQIRQESRFFPTPPAFEFPIRGSPTNIAMTRMVWLSEGEKIEDIFIPFDIVYERMGQIDRQTPRDGIGPAYA